MILYTNSQGSQLLFFVEKSCVRRDKSPRHFCFVRAAIAIPYMPIPGRWIRCFASLPLFIQKSFSPLCVYTCLVYTIVMWLIRNNLCIYTATWETLSRCCVFSQGCACLPQPWNKWLNVAVFVGRARIDGSLDASCLCKCVLRLQFLRAMTEKYRIQTIHAKGQS